MMEFLRCLHADFIKIKRRPVLWIHLLVPIVGILFTLLEIRLTKSSPASGALTCLGLIGAAFPILIGVVCSMIADQEAEAGSFQQLLTAPFRPTPFLSMAVLLLLLGFGAELFTAFGFYAASALFLHQAPFGPAYYWSGALLLFVCNIFLYFLHLFLSLRFNKGVSIGVGIFESLLSALLMTGLGEGIWPVIPCGWGLHFLRLFGMQWGGTTLPAAGGFQVGAAAGVVETALMVVFSVLWCLRWEGKKTEE
jgi:lantibiotic protection ABC transporter MutG family permease subunit